MAYKQPTASPAHTKASMKYDRENNVPLAMKLNKKTDADVIDHLEKVMNGGKESKRAYIIRLIREDIARNQ